MKCLNPLENIREAIIKSQSPGIKNEITQIEVSDEILALCDVFDSFYGIDRSPMPNTIKPGLMKVVALDYRGGQDSCKPIILPGVFQKWDLSKLKKLLNDSKPLLETIKEKLSKDNSLYIDLSSKIVYIVLDDIISTVNSYQKDIEHEVSKFGRFVVCDNYNKLIKKSIELMTSLKDFDMSEDCRMGYDNFLKELKSIVQSNNKIIAQNNKIIAHYMKTSLEETKKGGCVLVMIFLLGLSVSISSFFFA